MYKVYTESFCISTDKYNCSLTEKRKILKMRTPSQVRFTKKDVNYTNFCQASTDAKYAVLCKNIHGFIIAVLP